MRDLICFVLGICVLVFSSTLHAQEILLNPGFEGTYSSRATSWLEHKWSNDSSGSASYEPVSTNVHSGTFCQKMTVNTFGPAGGLFLYQYVDVNIKRLYQATAWVRAVSPTTVRFYTRVKNGAPYYYRICGISKVDVGTQWQEVKYLLHPAYDNSLVDYQFAIAPTETGISIYIDDVSLVDVTDNKMAEVSDKLANALPVDESYFGLHLNKVITAYGHRRARN